MPKEAKCGIVCLAAKKKRERAVRNSPWRRDKTMNWEALAAISQFVEAIAVVAALLYAWQQIRAMRQEQLLGAIWQIYQELDSSETRQARRYVYCNRAMYQTLAKTGESTLSELPEEARRNAERVSSTFDRIGYVIHKELIPADLVLDGYSHIIARCWTALEPFVQSVRVYRREKDYQRYFECLGSAAIERVGGKEKVIFQMY
ncbi:MAG: hypothetical protein WBW48_19905 [Anaerolineae bacterium]